MGISQEVIEKIVGHFEVELGRYRSIEDLVRGSVEGFDGVDRDKIRELEIRIQSQIGLLGVMGGVDLIREVCNGLEDIDIREENGKELAGAFDKLADGVGEWVK